MKKRTSNIDDDVIARAVNAEAAASAAQGNETRSKWAKKSKKKFVRLINMPISGDVPDVCRPMFRYPLESLVGLVGSREVSLWSFFQKFEMLVVKCD